MWSRCELAREGSDVCHQIDYIYSSLAFCRGAPPVHVWGICLALGYNSNHHVKVGKHWWSCLYN